MRGSNGVNAKRRQTGTGGAAGGETFQPFDTPSIPQYLVFVKKRVPLSDRPAPPVLLSMLTLAVRRGDTAIFRELAALALRWRAKGALHV